jgi:RNA-binding protein YhbY
MIHNHDEFRRFVQFLPTLKDDEVWFLSLSARNKYLTEKERAHYGLGRTEMFSRFTARDTDPGIEYVCQKLQATLAYRRTKGGKEIPEKALVTYMNVNPSSTVNGYYLFKQEMDSGIRENLQAYMNGNQPRMDAFRTMERKLMNAIQRSTSRKELVDIDVDTKSPEVMEYVHRRLAKCQRATVETVGGYHVLVRREDLRAHSVNLGEVVGHAQALAGTEVAINKNGMVPLPGTLQAGHLVQFQVHVRVVDIRRTDPPTSQA